MKRSQHVFVFLQGKQGPSGPTGLRGFPGDPVSRKHLLHTAWVKFVTDQKYTFGRQTIKCMIKYCRGNLRQENDTLLKKVFTQKL